MKPTVELRRVTCWLAIMAFLTAFLALPVSSAQDDEASVSFSSQTQFAIPSTNGSISFAMGGSYGNASLENNKWIFNVLSLPGSTDVWPKTDGVKFGMSAHDCQVTITRLHTVIFFPPHGSGILEYTVSGVGIQSFNVFYFDNGFRYIPRNMWLNYSVQIDGVSKLENEGWTMAPDGWITVASASSNVKITWDGRTTTDFSSTEHFDVPSLNGSISFDGSGTYIFAYLENNMWRFQDLELNGIKPQGAPYWALGISAEDSNVTVTGYLARWGTAGRGWLNYTVVGVGNQTFNPNLEEKPDFPLNYTVYIDGEKAENSSWTNSDGGWMTATGAKANVSVYSESIIPDWFKNMPTPPPPGTPPPSIDLHAKVNWPLIVLIVSGVAVAVAIVVVASVKIMAKRKKNMAVA